MNCLSDKQNHRFIICIGLFCIFLLIFFLSFGWMQSCQVRDGFFVWEKKVASSLLEQGVEEEVVAEAFESQNSSGQGELFLQKIGHVKGNVPVLFDLPGQLLRPLGRSPRNGVGKILGRRFRPSLLEEGGRLGIPTKRKSQALSKRLPFPL